MLAIALVLGLARRGARAAPASERGDDTFVSSSSPDYRATQSFYRSFGEEPVEVLVKGNLQQLVLSSDIERLRAWRGACRATSPRSALAGEGGVERALRAARARHRRSRWCSVPARSSTRRPNEIDEQLDRADQAGRSAGQAGRTRSSRSAALARGLSAREAATLGEQASKITIGAL